MAAPCAGVGGASEHDHHESRFRFGAPNLDYRSAEVCAPTGPPLMPTIHPNMLTNWYKFGPHWAMYVRVIVTALLIWVYTGKHAREMAARVHI